MLSPANRTALRTYEKSGFRRFRLIDILCGPASAPGMSAVIFTLGMGNAVEEVIGSMVDDPRPGDPRRGRPASDLP
jgi:hypothetical protein